MDIGQDPNLARLARMNMYLHGDGGSSIFEADFLDKDFSDQSQVSPEASIELDQLRKIFSPEADGLVDIVLTNPPFAKVYERKNPRQARDHGVRTID